MLTLLVPILISFLLEGSQLRSATKFTLQLHEQSLQWLMKIGPKYPQVRVNLWVYEFSIKLKKLQFLQQFKTLMGQAPDLRSKLETAIRSSQQQAANLQKATAESTKESKTAVPQAPQPTIKLKTDFSNFS